MKGVTVILILISVGCLLKLRPVRNAIRWLISAKYRRDRRLLKALLYEKSWLQSRLNEVVDKIRALRGLK